MYVCTLQIDDQIAWETNPPPPPVCCKAHRKLLEFTLIYIWRKTIVTLRLMQEKSNQTI